MKVEMMWRKRYIKASSTSTGTTKIYIHEFVQEPEFSDDYWVTDGYIVHKGHYDKGSNSWGIYQTDNNGVIKHCYTVDD